MRNKRKINRIEITLIMIIICGFIIANFFLKENEVKLTIEPEVRVTNNIYNNNSLDETFWTPSIYYYFNNEYGGKYSEKLRNKIIKNIEDQAKNLGEYPEEVRNCLFGTGQFEESYSNKIPCLAEKAKFAYHKNYKGESYNTFLYNTDDYKNESNLSNKTIEPCWIFVINWGFREEGLGHIKIYVISTLDYSIITWNACG